MLKFLCDKGVRFNDQDSLRESFSANHDFIEKVMQEGILRIDSKDRNDQNLLHQTASTPSDSFDPDNTERLIVSEIGINGWGV